jgi:hypothetical protein
VQVHPVAEYGTPAVARRRVDSHSAPPHGALLATLSPASAVTLNPTLEIPSLSGSSCPSADPAAASASADGGARPHSAAATPQPQLSSAGDERHAASSHPLGTPVLEGPSMASPPFMVQSGVGAAVLQPQQEMASPFDHAMPGVAAGTPTEAVDSPLLASTPAMVPSQPQRDARCGTPMSQLASQALSDALGGARGSIGGARTLEATAHDGAEHIASQLLLESQDLATGGGGAGLDPWELNLAQDARERSALATGGAADALTQAEAERRAVAEAVDREYARESSDVLACAAEHGGGAAWREGADGAASGARSVCSGDLEDERAGSELAGGMSLNSGGEDEGVHRTRAVSAGGREGGGSGAVSNGHGAVAQDVDMREESKDALERRFSLGSDASLSPVGTCSFCVLFFGYSHTRTRAMVPSVWQDFSHNC